MEAGSFYPIKPCLSTLRDGDCGRSPQGSSPTLAAFKELFLTFSWDSLISSGSPLLPVLSLGHAGRSLAPSSLLPPQTPIPRGLPPLSPLLSRLSSSPSPSTLLRHF